MSIFKFWYIKYIGLQWSALKITFRREYREFSSLQKHAYENDLGTLIFFWIFVVMFLIIATTWFFQS